MAHQRRQPHGRGAAAVLSALGGFRHALLRSQKGRNRAVGPGNGASAPPANFSRKLNCASRMPIIAGPGSTAV
ncbi:hypothetical protein [Lysobacter gummosus]|uniref:hypothetical protein n=1 Tax=Lysobacter gummosus TaxID=262324 RepID=UPI00363A6C69